MFIFINRGVIPVLDVHVVGGFARDDVDVGVEYVLSCCATVVHDDVVPGVFVSKH